MEKLDQIIIEESAKISNRRELFSAVYNRTKLEGLNVTYIQVQKRVPELIGKPTNTSNVEEISTPVTKINPHRTIFS